MAQLTYQQRKNLPTKSFVMKGKKKYPIEDIAHARNALARVSQFGTPEEKAQVRSAVYSKYPELKKSSKRYAMKK